MDRNFTKNDVLLLIYNELDSETTEALKQELMLNEELNAYYHDTLRIIGGLDQMEEMTPSETSVQIVLEESLSSPLEAI